MYLDAITIKFALNNNFLPMKLFKRNKYNNPLTKIFNHIKTRKQQKQNWMPPKHKLTRQNDQIIVYYYVEKSS